jgi:hypothetical protein
MTRSTLKSLSNNGSKAIHNAILEIRTADSGSQIAVATPFLTFNLRGAIRKIRFFARLKRP